MKPIRAFVEAPAGLASVSLRLHGGPHCRPPISRMGNKAGYAEAILGLAGLRSGQSAGAFVWAEADADVRGLLRAYPDAAMLRRVADIIRGWADEEPRALWERLRAERKARGPVADDAGVAGWIVTGGWAFRGGEPESGFRDPYGGFSGSGRDGGSDTITLSGLRDRCITLSEYAQLVVSNRLINIGGPTLENTGKGGTTLGGKDFATPAGETAEGFERLAAHLWVTSRQFSGAETGGGCGMKPPIHSTGGFANYQPDAPAAALDALASRWPPVAVLPSIPTAAELSAMLGTPGDLDGVVVYKDPDYQGTTGYAATYPRADVVKNAMEAAAMGALVMVSEAVALPELVAAGWYAERIDHARRGAKRTFSKQQAEWVTMNRAPVHIAPKQAGLFG